MNTSSFKDHFSKQAKDYVLYRPHYPPQLFEYLASLCEHHQKAWDVATGNGQAALSLAPYFENIFATDASEQQILATTPHPKIEYSVEAAEKTNLESSSVDLITIAQAIHWLDHEKFYGEALRVLKPKGILAVWVYDLHHISPKIDEITRRYYHDVVGPFWPPERRYIEEKLTTIPFPLQIHKIEVPDFFMNAFWDVETALGYFNTWSAAQRYKEAKKEDPLQRIKKEFREAWGSASKKLEVKWPLYFRIGQK